MKIEIPERLGAYLDAVRDNDELKDRVKEWLDATGAAENEPIMTLLGMPVTALIELGKDFDEIREWFREQFAACEDSLPPPTGSLMGRTFRFILDDLKGRGADMESAYCLSLLCVDTFRLGFVADE